MRTAGNQRPSFSAQEQVNLVRSKLVHAVSTVRQVASTCSLDIDTIRATAMRTEALCTGRGASSERLRRNPLRMTDRLLAPRHTIGRGDDGVVSVQQGNGRRRMPLRFGDFLL